jgi:hypothetical protein
MAHTKELLEAADISDIVAGVRIDKLNFTNEQGQAINYNKVVIEFANGDELALKPEKADKVVLYYAIRDGNKK